MDIPDVLTHSGLTYYATLPPEIFEWVKGRDEVISITPETAAFLEDESESVIMYTKYTRKRVRGEILIYEQSAGRSEKLRRSDTSAIPLHALHAGPELERPHPRLAARGEPGVLHLNVVTMGTPQVVGGKSHVSTSEDEGSRSDVPNPAQNSLARPFASQYARLVPTTHKNCLFPMRPVRIARVSAEEEVVVSAGGDEVAWAGSRGCSIRAAETNLRIELATTARPVALGQSIETSAVLQRVTVNHIGDWSKTYTLSLCRGGRRGPRCPPWRRPAVNTAGRSGLLNIQPTPTSAEDTPSGRACTFKDNSEVYQANMSVGHTIMAVVRPLRATDIVDSHVARGTTGLSSTQPLPELLGPYLQHQVYAVTNGAHPASTAHKDQQQSRRGNTESAPCTPSTLNTYFYAGLAAYAVGRMARQFSQCQDTRGYLPDDCAGVAQSAAQRLRCLRRGKRFISKWGLDAPSGAELYY
ncbi:hypothetical protein FB451DRAFT_1182507 [Mycena latifolia]|nr:hypothetical protein FB451DRAFT_1182507 [Mycena latifolia]